MKLRIKSVTGNIRKQRIVKQNSRSKKNLKKNEECKQPLGNVRYTNICLMGGCRKEMRESRKLETYLKK